MRQHNHALTLLLLSNGYDPDREPRRALDTALELRRADLVELLLAWGADPHRFDRALLFETYDAALFDRFYRLGVDLTERHALAEALGYHTSNKPLYGFAKRYHRTDARIQRDLDMALAHHAWEGSEKGALLCLWAGGDPHKSAPSLRYYDEDDEDEEEASPKDVGEIRRTLLRLDDYRFRELVRVLATELWGRYAEQIARTPAFQRRLQEVELMPEPGDRWWTRRRWADEAREVVSAFGLDTTPPPKPRRRR